MNTYVTASKGIRANNEANVGLGRTTAPTNAGSVDFYVDTFVDYILVAYTATGMRRASKRRDATTSIQDYSFGCQGDHCVAYIESAGKLYRITIWDRVTMVGFDLPWQSLEIPNNIQRVRTACTPHQCTTAYQEIAAASRSIRFFTETLPTNSSLSQINTAVGANSLPPFATTDGVTTELSATGSASFLMFPKPLDDAAWAYYVAILQSNSTAFEAPLAISETSLQKRAGAALACDPDGEECVAFWKVFANATWEGRGRYLGSSASQFGPIFSVGAVKDNTHFLAAITSGLAFLFSDGPTLDARWYGKGGDLLGEDLNFNSFPQRTFWCALSSNKKVVFTWQNGRLSDRRTFTVIRPPPTEAPTPNPTPMPTQSTTLILPPSITSSSTVPLIFSSSQLPSTTTVFGTVHLSSTFSQPAGLGGANAAIISVIVGLLLSFCASLGLYVYNRRTDQEEPANPQPQPTHSEDSPANQYVNLSTIQRTDETSHYQKHLPEQKQSTEADYAPWTVVEEENARY